MKKFAHIAGALLLATTSLSAYSAVAANVSSVGRIATALAADAKRVEAAERKSGVTDDAKISAAIAASTASLLQSFIQSGATSTDISAAMTQVLSSGNLSPDATAGLSTVNGELASLETGTPAATGRGEGRGRGNGGVNPPSPPPPPAAGSGYQNGQGNQGNQNNQGNQG